MKSPEFGVDVVSQHGRFGASKLALGVVATTLALALFASGAAAAELEVASGGTDSGDCQTSACATIQYAVGQAADGDTISVAAGTYDEAVEVTVPNLTIAGADPLDRPLVRPPAVNLAAAFSLMDESDGLTLRNLDIGSPNPSPLTNNLSGVRAANAGGYDISGVTLTDVGISGLNWGVMSADTGASSPNPPVRLLDWTIEDSIITGNQFGLYFGSRVQGLDLNSFALDGNDFGIYSRYLNYSPRQPNLFDDVSVSDGTIDLSGKKGVYLEAASNLTVEGVSVSGTGTQPPIKADPDPIPFVGVDVNLKYGDFSNIALTDMSVEDTGFDPAALPQVQAGVAIKARNDGSYASIPASAEEVSVRGLELNDNQHQGLVLGGSLSDVEVSGNHISGNALAGLSIVRETPGTGATIADLAVTGNDFSGNGNGFLTATGSDGAVLEGLDFSLNRIAGNTVGVNSDLAQTLDLSDNWWGCNSGPNQAGCDHIIGNVDSDPWLVLRASAAPDMIEGGGSSTVTASMNTNSDGEVAGTYPLGGQVDFTTDLGEVDPASATLADGTATAELSTERRDQGVAAVEATYEGVTDTALVAVNGPPNATLYVDGSTGDDAGNQCDVQASPCATIQHAIDMAVGGDTIQVAPGEYQASSGDATALVDKPGLTISGAGIDETVVTPPDTGYGKLGFSLAPNADGLTLSDLSVVDEGDPISTGSQGVALAEPASQVDDVTLDGIELTGLEFGVQTSLYEEPADISTTTGWAITDSSISDNEFGLWFQGETRDLTITGSEVDGNDHGLSAYPATAPNATAEPGVFDGVQISGTSFDENSKKGIYLEAASDLSISGSTVNGTGSTTPVNPSTQNFDGIDLNLKFGDFENVSITDTTVQNTELNGSPANPNVQAAVSIKTRNDGGYAGNPASLSNVDISGLNASQNEHQGLILGGDLDDVQVADSTFRGNPFAGIALMRESAGTGSSVTGLSVSGSTFEDNGSGIRTNAGSDATAVDGLEITDNSFVDNDQAAAGDSRAIGLAGVTGTDLLILENRISGTNDGDGNGTTAVALSAGGGQTVTNLQVIANTSEDDGSFLILSDVQNAAVIENLATDESGAGIVLTRGAKEVLLVDNELEGGITGVVMGDVAGSGQTAIEDVTISGGSVSGMAGDGVLIGGKVTGAPNPTVTGVRVEDLSVTGNGNNGVTVPDSAAVSGAGVTVATSEIVGNGGLGIENEAAMELVATDNWWGCNAGPGAPGCDGTAGAVDSSPNVVLRASAAPNRVAKGGQAQVTATLDSNSAGQPVEMPVLDGEAVEFAAARGSVSSASAELLEGEAVSGFTASQATGDAGVTAAFDGETLQVPLFVGAGPTLGAPSLTGTGEVGVPLVCSPTAVSGVPEAQVAIGWLRNGAAIGGAAGAGYVPTQDDAGQQITCRTVATNEFGQAAATSAPVTIQVPAPPPPPEAPKVNAKTNQVTVPSNGRVVVAMVTCPEGTCTVSAPKTVRVKIGKKTYKVKVVAPSSVDAGSSAPIKLILPKGARKALKGKKAKAKIKITVTSSDGQKTVSDKTVRIKGKKAK